MFTKAYTVMDTKVGFYMPPFFVQHDAQAIRSVIEAVADERTTLSKYPADFVLFRVGEFDDTVGQLNSTPPVNLGSAAALYAAHLQSVGSCVRRVDNGEILPADDLTGGEVEKHHLPF